MWIRFYFLTTFCVLICTIGFAQTTANLITGNYQTILPFGDLGTQFGINHKIGGGYMYKTSNDVLVGLEGNFIFGPTVKQTNLIDDYSTENGQLININGTPIGYQTFARGFNMNVRAGKIFNFNANKPDGGFTIMGSLGVLQHRIFIDVHERDVPAFSDDVKAAFDQSRIGPSASQFIGWSFINADKYINLLVGLEMTEAYTFNQRDWDPSRNASPTSEQLDLYIGLKLAWIIPIFGNSNEDFFD